MHPLARPAPSRPCSRISRVQCLELCGVTFGVGRVGIGVGGVGGDQRVADRGDLGDHVLDIVPDVRIVLAMLMPVVFGMGLLVLVVALTEFEQRKTVGDGYPGAPEPDASYMSSSQVSKPMPFSKIRSASARAAICSGFGSKVWASPSGPTITVRSTAIPRHVLDDIAEDAERRHDLQPFPILRRRGRTVTCADNGYQEKSECREAKIASQHQPEPSGRGSKITNRSANMEFKPLRNPGSDRRSRVGRTQQRIQCRSAIGESAAINRNRR